MVFKEYGNNNDTYIMDTKATAFDLTIAALEHAESWTYGAAHSKEETITTARARGAWEALNYFLDIMNETFDYLAESGGSDYIKKIEEAKEKNDNGEALEKAVKETGIFTLENIAPRSYTEQTARLFRQKLVHEDSTHPEIVEL